MRYLLLHLLLRSLYQPLLIMLNERKQTESNDLESAARLAGMIMAREKSEIELTWHILSQERSNVSSKIFMYLMFSMNVYRCLWVWPKAAISKLSYLAQKIA